MISTRLLAPLLALTFVPVATWAEQDYSDTVITTTPVRDGIYMLEGKGGNIGVCAGDDGVFMIDDQFAPLAPKINAAIETISDQPVRFLMNTHYHGDHTGGNEIFGKGGAVIVAHKNVRSRRSVDQFISAFNKTVEAAPKEGLPIVTFKEAVTFHLNDEDIHVIHLGPAHTDGDSIVHFPKANVVHMGDNFFNGFYPFIDKDGGGSVDGVITTVDHVLEMTDAHTLFIPGHGPLGDREQLVAFRDFLADARSLVGKHVKAGDSLEDTLAANPLAAHDAAWGQGFLSTAKFTTILYNLLQP